MSDEITALRDFGIAVLKRRYGAVEPLSGQGVQRGTRVKFTDEGKPIVCGLKVTGGPRGRISFPYADGTWGALSQVDRVLYVRLSPEHPGQLEAQFHKQQTLLDAFNKNCHAAEAKKFTNLPAWLSADHEDAERFIGSGFGRFALWKELSGTAMPAKTPSTPTTHSFAAAVERAKQNLAAELGLSASAIDITIRA